MWRYPHFLPPFRQVRNLTHVIFQFFYTLKDLIVGSRGVVFDCSSGYFHHAITASLGLADLSSVYAIVLHICWLSLCMKITVLCNVTLGGLRLARKASLTELSSHGKVRLPTIAAEHRISTNEWYDSMYWRSINQVSPRSNVFLSVKTPYCELCYACFHCGGNHCQGELKVVCHSSLEVILIWLFLLCCIFRCGEPRSGAWCEADMSPVIEASWRVHWRHVTWPLVGVKVSL